MLKLICVSFSVIVLGIAAAAGAQPHPASAGAAMASASTCQAARLVCKADCADLGGGALGACLRACDVEYNECLSGQPSLADIEASAAGPRSESFATQPEGLAPLGLTCFEKLELCGESCGNDVSCNRACVRAYQQCLGH